jgi:hypothetical protein
LHFFYFARRESAKSSEKENLVNPARAKSMMNRPSRMLVLVVQGFLQLTGYQSQLLENLFHLESVGEPRPAYQVPDAAGIS